MAIDPMWIWIAAGAAGVLLVVLLIAGGARRSRTEALRDKYGREYEHAVKATGSRTRAERDLIERAEEVKSIEIGPLSASRREHFRSEWSRVEMRFLERPTTAVIEADEMIDVIMRERGYPMGHFEKHAAHLSVNHPNIVEHYRAGHAAIDSNRDGKSSTEELRQAMLHYRSLFHELVGPERKDLPQDVAVSREIEERPRG